MSATVRFSNGSGNPRHPDYAPDPRGLAVKLYLPDGSRTDIVAVSTPVFPRGRRRASSSYPSPGGRSGRGLEAGAVLHPSPRGVAGDAAGCAHAAPPASYATIPYHALHAYRWTDAEGGSASCAQPRPRRRSRGSRPGRRAGGARTTCSARSPSGWSRDRSCSRSRPRSPTRGTRPTIRALHGPNPAAACTIGALRITGLDTERERDGDVLVFDPAG